jgi:hypothetical protein
VAAWGFVDFYALAFALVAFGIVGTPAVAAVSSTCADVTGWSISIPPAAYYDFVKTGGGWVGSYNLRGSKIPIRC